MRTRAFASLQVLVASTSSRYDGPGFSIANMDSTSCASSFNDLKFPVRWCFCCTEMAIMKVQSTLAPQLQTSGFQKKSDRAERLDVDKRSSHPNARFAHMPQVFCRLGHGGHPARRLLTGRPELEPPHEPHSQRPQKREHQNPRSLAKVANPKVSSLASKSHPKHLRIYPLCWLIHHCTLRSPGWFVPGLRRARWAQRSFDEELQQRNAFAYWWNKPTYPDCLKVSTS